MAFTVGTNGITRVFELPQLHGDGIPGLFYQVDELIIDIVKIMYCLPIIGG